MKIGGFLKRKAPTFAALNLVDSQESIVASQYQTNDSRLRTNDFPPDVVKLVDTSDLGSDGVSYGGSSPSIRTSWLVDKLIS